jgi:hypothetical protein
MNAEMRAAARGRMVHRAEEAGRGESQTDDKPKPLRMINRADTGALMSGQKAAFSRPLDEMLRICDFFSHERFPRHLLHLPRDY